MRKDRGKYRVGSLQELCPLFREGRPLGAHIADRVNPATDEIQNTSGALLPLVHAIDAATVPVVGELLAVEEPCKLLR